MITLINDHLILKTQAGKNYLKMRLVRFPQQISHDDDNKGDNGDNSGDNDDKNDDIRDACGTMGGTGVVLGVLLGAYRFSKLFTGYMAQLAK